MYRLQSNGVCKYEFNLYHCGNCIKFFVYYECNITQIIHDYNYFIVNDV